MTRKERIQSEIVFTRQLLLGLLFVVEAPLVAWVALSFRGEPDMWVWLGVAAAIVLLGVLGYLARVHRRLHDYLEGEE